MVANLSELHQNVDDPQKIARLESVLGDSTRHEILVEKSLSFGELTGHYVVVLVR